MRHAKRLGVAGFAVSVVVALVWASAAWACVPGRTERTLGLDPPAVRQGGQVTVTTQVGDSKAPVVLHLNNQTGPVLATLPTDGAGPEGLTSTFTVPVGLAPGRYAIVASQGDTVWEPAVLGVAGADGFVPQAAPSAAEVIAAADPPADTFLPRAVAGFLAMALAGLAINSAVRHRLLLRAGGSYPPGVWNRTQPSALALASGAAAWAAIRPDLDGWLVLLGVVALAAGLLARRRFHFFPIGLVLGGWGLAVWLASEGHLPDGRGSASTVTGLGVGLFLSATLARSAEQRAAWLYTGALTAMNAGITYYVMYDLPAWAAEWPAWSISLVAWAGWEQVRADRMSRADANARPGGGGLNDGPMPVASGPDQVLEPSVR